MTESMENNLINNPVKPYPSCQKCCLKGCVKKNWTRLNVLTGYWQKLYPVDSVNRKIYE